AEDGIRDRNVTGVQTCALPIFVDAADSGLAGVDPADAERCFADTLDKTKVAGKVVLCKRGVNPRIEKSKNVKDAGGVGMILYNEIGRASCRERVEKRVGGGRLI